MKRAFDLIVAVILLIALLPLLIVSSICVAAFIGRPILFAQERPGLRGKSFKLLKLRTMRNLTDQSGRYLPDSQRLTRFGRVLRATSLDELPELWNILRGDMSLVGPRPLLMEYLPLYSAAQARRHEARPGITGWAQVNGRNAISWEEKFRLDVWYVDNQSVWLDFKILFMTLVKVVTKEGITSDGHVTMPPFKGQNHE